MPGLPPAQSLENYHQFSKFFAWEVDGKEQITDQAKEKRVDGFNDPVPRRHKFEKTLKKSGNPNTPLFSITMIKMVGNTVTPI
jgi:hypothetical protein